MWAKVSEGSAAWRTRRGEPHSPHLLAAMSRSWRQSRQKQVGPSTNAGAVDVTARRAPIGDHSGPVELRQYWWDEAVRRRQTPLPSHHRASRNRARLRENADRRRRGAGWREQPPLTRG